MLGLEGEVGRLTYLLAILAACANATSLVLQRKANREVPQKQNLSPGSSGAWRTNRCGSAACWLSSLFPATGHGAVLGLLAIGFIWWRVPETRGKALEQIENEVGATPSADR